MTGMLTATLATKRMHKTVCLGNAFLKFVPLRRNEKHFCSLRRHSWNPFFSSGHGTTKPGSLFVIHTRLMQILVLLKGTQMHSTHYAPKSMWNQFSVLWSILVFCSTTRHAVWHQLNQTRGRAFWFTRFNWPSTVCDLRQLDFVN